MAKRIHLHFKVTDLAASRTFYSALFDSEPELVREDHIKWRVEDPPLNLAISPAESPVSMASIDHLGIEVSEAGELSQLDARHGDTPGSVREPQAQCCYAESDKLWVRDPDRISWELFLTHAAETDPATAEGAAPPVADGPRTMPSINPASGGGCC